jgi:hypothetical protein
MLAAADCRRSFRGADLSGEHAGFVLLAVLHSPHSQGAFRVHLLRVSDLGAPSGWVSAHPTVEYYWSFRWTIQVARFLDDESGKPGAAKIWPGILLAGTSVLGLFTQFKSLRLFLVFGLGIYLTRQLRAVLPACRPFSLKRWQRWNLSMSAGVGAAFSFVLVQALRHFSIEQPKEKLHDLVAILFVSVGVLIFLEPLFESLRVVLGIADNHPALKARKPWRLRLAVFLILVFTSLFHGLLHSEIEKAMEKDWSGTLTMLLAGLLVSGGITYFWIGAAHRRPSHAARSGLISGAVLGVLVASAVLAAVAAPNAATAATNQLLAEQAIHSEFPFVPAKVIDELAKGNLGDGAEFGQMMVIAFPWPIFGLIGGVAIDRRWGNGKSQSVALSVVAAAVLCEASLWLTGRLAPGGEMLSHLSMAVGWGLALVICSSSRILMPAEAMESGSTG